MSTLVRRVVCGLTVAFALVATPEAPAQGRIIIEPPDHGPPPRPMPGPGQTTLFLRALNVQAEITDGVAVTRVEQTFQNPLGRQVEGTYIFPLPDEVAVGEFAMTVGGKTLQGEVLDANTARQTYEEIVRRTRDPGLLEYLGARLFRARIFPIPPNGKVEVKLQYSQTLTEQGGLGLFRHPLRSDPAGTQSVDQLVLSVKLHSTVPLTTVFSPSHECVISRRSDYDAAVSYEAAHVLPDRDFLLYYQRKDAAFGLALLTHHAAGEPGTFLLRISPRIDLPADQVLPKDIAFVIDTSGSMAGEKLAQAKRALKFCVGSLNTDDRFNIYGFSTDVHPFRETLVPAGSDVKEAAVQFAEQLKALGGTNINGALLGALGDDPHDDQRPYLVVFMTDGQPTVDVTNPEQILASVAQRNTRHIRFHVLGVGAEVNTHLLDKLAEATRGARDYCSENEDLELKLSAFVARLANPVLTDLKLHVDGGRVSDVYPHELPDLFRGNDLVVLGRYDDYGPISIRLDGQVLGSTKTIGYEGDFPKVEPGNDFLPRLWANRKVAYLLDQIRLHGENRELVDEVVRLAKRYGIVTPYTSALILEDGVRLGGHERPVPTTPSPARDRGRRAAAAGRAAAPAPAAGAEAVQASKRLGKAKDADALSHEDESAPADGQKERAIRHAGDKTFTNIDGRWTDTTWNEEQKPKSIVAFSDEYFALLRRHPELKAYFALGPRVLVVLGDEVYETQPEPDPAPPR